MPSFAGWAFSDLAVTGPDPFSSNATGNSSSPGNSTLTINPGVTPTLITMTDDDSLYTDGDSGQRYTGPADFNGGNVSGEFDVGDRIETEYSYIIRPQGSSNPADNITIYMIEIDADGQGIAADGQLVPGVTYDIIAIESNSPVVDYADLFVCFATGTRIATPEGARPIETLLPGDLVETLDHGPQPILWAGWRRLHFQPGPHDQKPVLFPMGALGGGVPTRDLVVSPQHRMLIGGPDLRDVCGSDQALALAKGLLPLPRVRVMQGCRRVTYHTLLLPRHEVLLAEGAPVESLYPGPIAMQALDPAQRAEVRALFPRRLTDPAAEYGPHARPVLRRRDAVRLAKARRSVGVTA